MGKSTAHLEEEGDEVILIKNGEPAKKNKAVPKPKEGKSEGANVTETKQRKKREVETEVETEAETEETPDKGASEEGCPPLETPKKKKKGKKMKIEREDSQDMEVRGSGVIQVQRSGMITVLLSPSCRQHISKGSVVGIE